MRDDNQNLIRARCITTTSCEEAPTYSVVQICSLREADEIDIQTRENRLLLRVVDPRRGEVALTTYEEEGFSDEVCLLAGATWGGSCVWLRRIVVGLFIEITHPRDPTGFVRFPRVERVLVRRSGKVVGVAGSLPVSTNCQEAASREPPSVPKSEHRPS